MSQIGTFNDDNECVDLFIPRKCHASNVLIQSFDYASIQIAIADIDADGTYNGNTKTFCISGVLRNESESDHAINRLCVANGIIRPKTGHKTKKTQAAEKQNAKDSSKKAAAKLKKPVGRGRGAAPAGRGAKKGGERPPRREGAPKGDRPPRREGAPKGDRPPRREGAPQGDRKPRAPKAAEATA